MKSNNPTTIRSDIKYFLIYVTSNNRKDLLPCADGIVVRKPLGIPAGNDGRGGVKSRDVPSR